MIYIEGNIGVGKTTLLDTLREYHFNVITEPVEQWGEILQLYYKNKTKYSFKFQMKILLTWLEKFILLNETDLYFTERSLFSGRDIFFDTMCKNGYVSDKDKCEYYECFDKLVGVSCINKIIKPSAFIYLKASPEICFKRIQERKRVGEEHITLEYLETLDSCHQKWINEQRENGIPVLEIDNTVKHSPEDIIERILQLKDYI